MAFPIKSGRIGTVNQMLMKIVAKTFLPDVDKLHEALVRNFIIISGWISLL